MIGMENIDTRRINYVLQHVGQRELSRETGIPQTTISYVAKGERALPSYYYETLYKYYREDVYRTLREHSISTFESRTYMWRDPESIMFIENAWEQQIEFITGGRIANLWKDKEVYPTQEEIWDVWDEQEQIVRDSFEGSYKTVDEIFDYGKGVGISVM